MFFSYYNFLRPTRTVTRCTLGYTRISRPFFAFVTQPTLITHDAKCDPTREAANKVIKRNLTFGFLLGLQDRHSLFLSYRIWEDSESFFKKKGCIRGSRVHDSIVEYAVFVPTSNIDSCFRCFPGWGGYREIQRRTENVMNKNNSTKSSRTIESQQPISQQWNLVTAQCSEDARPSS